MKFEDIARAAKQSLAKQSSAKQPAPLPSSYRYRKTPNEKCVNLIDIIFDKILDLMSKDAKKNRIEKGIIIRGATNLKDPVKRFIMLNMSIDDAKDVLDKAKREIEND